MKKITMTPSLIFYLNEVFPKYEILPTPQETQLFTYLWIQVIQYCVHRVLGSCTKVTFNVDCFKIPKHL